MNISVNDLTIEKLKELSYEDLMDLYKSLPSADFKEMDGEYDSALLSYAISYAAQTGESSGMLFAVNEWEKPEIIPLFELRQNLIAPRTKKELGMHPLEIVASKELDNRRDEGHPLDLETMTLWLSSLPMMSTTERVMVFSPSWRRTIRSIFPGL